MFHVEKMEIYDTPFAVQLANTMNWNMTSSDFEFMMMLEPDGCFVLFHDLEHVGIATSISFGKVGWFGNLVVRENFRREGAGKILTNHAVGYLENKGVVTIGLYAYPHLVDFYENLGFESDIEFTVLKGKSVVAPTQDGLKEATKLDIPEIIKFDRQCFGANRQKLLEAILFNPNNLCYVLTEKSKISGYVAAKVHNKTAEVGPLICHLNCEEKAVLLLKSILGRLCGVDVFMYVPKQESELLKMLHRAGFREDFQVMRMFLGSAIAKNCICIAESLERG